VREAVSLAVDRRGMNQAETGGMGKPTGNWINDDVQYAIEWPEFPRNVEKAKQLLREAGYPNGFDVDWVTPLPTFYSRGERLIAQLREVGIRGRLQTMERGIFFQRLQGGLKEFQRPDHPARARSGKLASGTRPLRGGFNSRTASA
jgi:ABC-type transport system substrate-binding protein